MPHFILHYRTVHLKIKKYACAVCGCRFSRITNRNRHQKTCQFKREHYRRQMESDMGHGISELFRLQLGYQADSEFYKQVINCQYCDRKFYHEGGYRCHLTKVHEKRMWLPTVNLVKPKRIMTFVTDVGLHCPCCYQLFRGPRRKEIFKNHYSAIHLNIRRFQCSHCHKKFAQNGARKRHEIACKKGVARSKPPKPRYQIEIVGMESQPTESTVVCKHCKKQFESMRSRSSHEWRCSDRVQPG
ncbi:hypothetical protein ACHWQZ_G005927 [Mnemiopsis leidyi]